MGFVVVVACCVCLSCFRVCVVICVVLFASSDVFFYVLCLCCLTVG